jgi:hypothetical protein
MNQPITILARANVGAIPERSLLASVVLLAVNDACSAPPKTDRSKRTPAGLRIGVDAFTAMRFLFDDRVSGLDAYAEWLDFDLGHFRAKLRSIMADTGPLVIQGFESMQRRNFRFNYGCWLQTLDMDDVMEGVVEESEDD